MIAPLLLLLAAPQAAAPAPPNVVLIVADDLGWGDLGCYGQELVPTPRLDRLAAEGMRFTRFFSGSTVCAPSRSVLMTGQHVGRTRIRGNARDPLLPEDVTLAERLKALGYRTALFGKWGLGEEDSSGIPTRQGFDEFVGYLNQRHAHNSYPEYLLHGETRIALPNEVPENERWTVGEGAATKKALHSHDVFTDAALAYVATAPADEPFFLYLPYTIPHANNEAGRDGMEATGTAPFLGAEQADWPKTARDFASMLWALDRDVGRIVDLLDARGLGDNTLVLFTSDNGPHREGGHDPDRFDSNGPWRGIKRALYDGGIRVPLIARWPARVAAGTAADHMSGFQDFVPTLVAAAGGEVPGRDEGVDGLSFLATLEGRRDAQPAHEFLYWEFHERGKAQAVRTERWKLLRFRRNGETRLELYDLEADPGEEEDVVDSHPDVVRRLTGWMDGARTESERWKM